MVLQAIKYRRGSLQILDQLRLPHEQVYVDIKDPQDGWDAIKSMQVRGAPAIAIVAALSLAVYLESEEYHASIPHKPDSAIVLISQSLKFLTTSRPTAVNLLDATRKLEDVAYRALHSPVADATSVAEEYLQSAEQMLLDDVQDNKGIGKFGAAWIEGLCRSDSSDHRVSVITHCNTGSLATAGYGTALGVVRSLHSRGFLRQVFYTETRPYNQGARLTGFELLHDGIPAELVTDSMAGLLLAKRKHIDKIACVVVGADRVAANGDTANKIGTYTLAVLARFHNIKFLVAAPRTTVDLNAHSGSDIVIEERSIRELTCVKGPEIQAFQDGQPSYGALKEIGIAPPGTKAWNPAFDITPAELIDGIVTEKGVVEKGSDGSFHFETVFESQHEGKTSDDKPSANAKQLGIGPNWEMVVRMESSRIGRWTDWIRPILESE